MKEYRDYKNNYSLPSDPLGRGNVNERAPLNSVRDGAFSWRLAGPSHGLKWEIQVISLI